MDARDRYRIVGELGQGGVAEVLEAIALGEHGFERRVAIKRLRAHLADEDTLIKSFIDEARIASRLHHANIVAVLDFGVMDGAPFQVIELVEGLDARQMLDQLATEKRPFPIELALYVALQVAQALAHAHEATAPDGTPLGIVHRDVKPKNVLISWTGEVKLADFGIAFAKKRLQATEAGYLKGTLRFMAPEQALGGGVDRRTDVFALGCLLHALFTGRSPFGDELAAQTPEIAPHIPADVRAIIEKATKNAKSDRYDNAELVAHELSRALAKRAQDDPRASLKRFMESLRPKPALEVPKARAMLDVALLLGDAVDGTALRRFSSIAVTAEAREPIPAIEVEHDTAPRARRPEVTAEPLESFEPTRATVVDPPPPPPFPFRPALPERPAVPPTSSAVWKIVAWMTLVVIGVANLIVMLAPRFEEQAPVQIPVHDVEPAVRTPAVQPRPTEPREVRFEANRVEANPVEVDPVEAEPVEAEEREPRIAKKKPPRERTREPWLQPDPVRPPPTRTEVRATLQRLRERLENAELDAKELARLESRFLDLSSKEALARDEEDMRALASSASALDADLRRAEAAHGKP